MNSIRNNLHKFSEHPKKQATKTSRLVFAWMAPIFAMASRKNQSFEMTNLSNPMRSDESKTLTDRLESEWLKEVAINSRPSLLKAIIKCFIWEYLFPGLFIAFATLLRSIQPAVLKSFIQLFSNTTSSKYEILKDMYYFGTVLMSISVIIIFAIHHAEMQQERIGMRIRSAVTSLIYRKILKLSRGSFKHITSGQIINLLSNDVNRFDEVVKYINYLLVLPIQVPLIVYLMYNVVNEAAFYGVILMFFLTIPSQGVLGKLTSKYRLRMTQQTDYRIKLMYELISGIKVIKMYAWEMPFNYVVRMARKMEVNTLIKLSFLRGLFISFIMFVQQVSLFFTLITYASMGFSITADIVFSLAQFLSILQLSMAIFYPQAISNGAEVLVTIKRIREFLMLNERESLTKLRRTISGALKPGQIRIKNVSAKWSSDAPVILKSLSFNAEPGSLHAVIGKVGAGKSSFLNLLLGELVTEAKNDSALDLCGSISYASQEPWLFLGTVRSNILFGQEFDKERYTDVVRVCSLEKDFDQFPYRDMTIIGDRGVSLSGGQRARINLARAIYRRADIYLLDDPLSAVDSHVGRDIYEQCVNMFLKSKTTILVTHQVHFVRNIDHINVLNEGCIVASGSYTEIKDSVVGMFNEEIVSNESETREVKDDVIKRNLSFSGNPMCEMNLVPDQDNVEERKKLNKSSFLLYFKANENICGVFGLFIAMILGQISYSSCDYWVLHWTQADDRNTNKDFYVNVCIWIITSCIVMVIIRSILFYVITTRISRNLHNRMFKSLINAPMNFFDTNPLGRILNRFSKDIGASDDRLPNFLLEFLQIFLLMCGIFIMIILANPFMIVMIVILGTIFLRIRAGYLRGAENLKRLEGQMKSPIFSHVSATLDGITTIRNCNAEMTLCEEFDQLQNVHSSAFYLTIACTRAFGFWVDCVIVAFVCCITYSFIILYTFSSPLATASFVGLAISQSFILTGMLPYGMKKLADVVNEMTSVERILEYTQLPSEQNNACEKMTLGQFWPRLGEIKFENYFLKYSENGDPILKNLNLKIENGQRIGIVGRTGAGKSSMIAALFRLSSYTSGNIVIDEINIEDVNLEELRKKISIIPQEPVLFSATIRYNLDPFNQYTDQHLWSALAEVELVNSIKNLNDLVDENGANFSLGQRQLICLARAILRNNKILLLDEATANIDLRTDALIQKTIRRKFKDCTVLTIAHRLNTVIDSDKILVLDHGVVHEFDHPYALLLNENGAFSKLIAETGATNANQLKKLAKIHFESKTN